MFFVELYVNLNLLSNLLSTNMKRNKAILILIIFSFFALLICCCVFMFALSSVPVDENQYSSQVVQSGDETQTVAIVEVKDVISRQKTTDMWGNETPDMTSEIIKKIDQAQNDDLVKALLLEVDSPGGDVYASKLIYNKVVEFKETGKPVVAFMQDTAASGGYMVSAPADQIVASEVTVTGSIGVIASYVDYEELFDKVGLEQVNIVNTEGKNKAGEDLKDKESEAYILYQGILDDIYDEFIEIVADGRGMTKEEVIELADGRVYTGTQAIENGLIDELGEDKEAYDLIASLASLNNPNFIRYENEDNPFSLYSMSLKNILFPELSAIESKKPGLTVQYLMKI